ncbi:MAG: MATE family efflux transporter [Oscillospiraceae bacterium]|nr:MATE family efflux transporter [Oscillospiraceae bacterium]
MKRVILSEEGWINVKRYNRKTIRTAMSMAVPAIVESFFVAFAGLIDSLMVSSLGSNAVAAVGLTTQPKFMGLAVFLAINVSLSALVARRFGESKRKEANNILVTALVLIIALAVVLSIAFVALAPYIMSLCGSSPETHDSAVIYYRIIMGGMIFNCVQMGINSAQRGAGNTKITMRTNITSNTLNIVFNYLLINGHLGFPALGIKGAAIATVLGTVVSCIMSIISLMKPDIFVSIPYIIKEKIIPSWNAFKNIVKVGYSVFFEQILMRIGFMMTAIMAAKQGNAAMAAHQVGMNIMGLSFAFGDGLQTAAVALIGRSLGERKPERAKEFGRTCQMIGGIISVSLAVIYFFGAKLLMELFFREADIVAIGVTIMHIIIFVVLFQIRQVVYMGCLRGAGDTLYTAVASMISVTIIRTGVSYLCGYTLGWGIAGIWLGVLGDQLSRYVFATIRFKAGKWINIKI